LENIHVQIFQTRRQIRQNSHFVTDRKGKS
jgi:hypothetical protein